MDKFIRLIKFIGFIENIISNKSNYYYLTYKTEDYYLEIKNNEILYRSSISNTTFIVNDNDDEREVFMLYMNDKFKTLIRQNKIKEIIK